jgi:hypothetical protein
MEYHHYVLNLPQPIGPREFLLQTYFAQDPKTHRVELNLLAAPNRLAPVPGLVRIKHLNNIWTIDPRPNGEVDLTIVADADIGGNLPYFAKNAVLPLVLTEMFKSIRVLAPQDRYRNATMPHIVELDAAEGAKAPDAARVAQ